MSNNNGGNVSLQKVVNAIYKKSTRIKTETAYNHLSDEHLTELRGHYRKAGKGKPKNTTLDERIQHFVNNMPLDVINRIDEEAAQSFAQLPGKQNSYTSHI